MQKTNIFTRIAAKLMLTSMLLLAALVLFSWIVNATDTGWKVRSLLSADGIRWFFGAFSADLSTTLLVWLLLVSVAVGTFCSSGMCRATLMAFRLKPLQYRPRIALITAASIILALATAYCLMAFIPHAVLLSVTGSLLQSPFSAGLIPSAAFILTTASVIFGLQSGTFNNIDDTFIALTHGPCAAAPLVPLYITLMALWRSICFVFYF